MLPPDLLRFQIYSRPAEDGVSEIHFLTQRGDYSTPDGTCDVTRPSAAIPRPGRRMNCF
jgi:hypothetical protein